MEAGANDFLLKPLDKRSLEDALGNALARITRWKSTLLELFQENKVHQEVGKSRFPRRTQNPAAIKVPGNRGHIEKVNSFTLSRTWSMIDNFKILIIDDHPTMLTMLRQILKQMGFDTIQEAETAERALEILSLGDVRMVFTDLGLPCMSGIDLIRQIRQDRATHHLPVIVLSGISEQETVVEALKAGADNFIVKPCSADTIKEKLVQLLSNVPRPLPEAAPLGIPCLMAVRSRAGSPFFLGHPAIALKFLLLITEEPLDSTWRDTPGHPVRVGSRAMTGSGGKDAYGWFRSGNSAVFCGRVTGTPGGRGNRTFTG